MNLYEVYLWEPYEVPCCHKYFLDKEKAELYHHTMLKENAYWYMNEIETEDDLED